jgi:hypothetical protein
MGRVGFLGILILGGLLALPNAALASREDGSLRDGVYVSPTWGFSVRWYEDEWSIVSEATEDGSDSLWLEDESGARIGFEGRRGYAGDARACLEDVRAQVGEIYGVPGTAIRDEADQPQEILHPWRSWIALFVEGNVDGERADLVVYLDCRTLVADEAVLVRYLAVPVATFTDEDPRFDPLNAALPRSAWLGDPVRGLSGPFLYAESAASPFPADSLAPWQYPDDPHLLADELWTEFALLTVVDGDKARRIYVVMIENVGSEPLTIDPAQFSDSSNPREPGSDADISPVRASWDDGTAPGPRTLSPGTWASLTLEFPPLPAPRTQPSFLVYWDNQAEGGAVMLDCLDNCGYGGGGSRPRLRLRR